MSEEFRKNALDYHQFPTPGKLSIRATTSLNTQNDLALAYSPGVAYACESIEQEPLSASKYTARGNLVGVISNGTAVLGLGAIGPLASKPVMEGKAVLFKKFADIDVFDIEIDEQEPMLLAQSIKRLEPTFGGINLEDIKAPDCFVVEEYLREHMNIPVFHDDQHGTAIVVAAAMTSALEITGKAIDSVRLVASGAGAAALACLNLLVSMGLPRENIIVTDIDGVVYPGRKQGMDDYKARYAIDTPHRSLAEAIDGADIFLGLSAANVLKPEMLATMASQPIVFALANPNPEINPVEAHKVRDDIIMATGRSDFPNQVNNVLCFPFLFRGALDVGATEINEAMKIAAVHAISRLARASASDIVSNAYAGESVQFGPEYLIPKPFDPRLIVEVASSVAEAAMESGVASRPLDSLDDYRHRLSMFVYQSGLVMKPVLDQASGALCRVVYAEGENLRVLQAVDQLIEDKIVYPVLLGRPDVIKMQIRDYGLGMKEGRDFQIVYDPDLDHFADIYYRIMARRGVTRIEAQTLVRSIPTLLAALMVKAGDADCMICGSIGRYSHHLQHVCDVAEQDKKVDPVFALNLHILEDDNLFICDTQVNFDPPAEEIAAMTILAAQEIEHFGITPRAALLSHTNFGHRNTSNAVKMREALALIRERAPDLEVDGEMQADLALSTIKRNEVMPDSTLTGQANLLIMPNLDAANITANTLKTVSRGVTIGPILLGCALPCHVLTSAITVRGLVNMSTYAVSKYVSQPT